MRDELKTSETVPTELDPKASSAKFWNAFMITTTLLAVVSLIIVFAPELENAAAQLSEIIAPEFYLFVICGFIAQLIDGALGMAYGVSASTFLLSFGIPPAAASASIHASEVFTSGASGLMHLKLQNVNKKLFKTLLLPGVIGAIVGAYVLSSLETYNQFIKPAVGLYTLYLGIIIIRKATKGLQRKIDSKNIPKLAAFGGFMDSIGGGGWGPIVSSTLIAGGRHPRYTVGSVNLTEFFVSLASSITFFFVIGLSFIQIIIGLILGGLLAAPIAATLTKRLPLKTMMILVGVIVILVSIRTVFVSVQGLIF